MNESISGTGITDKQTEYNYNNTGIIEQVKTRQNNTSLTTTYQFDDLYRMHISSLKLKAGETEQEVLQNTYHYREGELAGSTTNYVKQHIINDRTFDYTYDVRGNITQISLNGNVVATYTYDEYDQLISETKNCVTTTWTYDAGGNILTKSHGDTIIEYTYGDAEWKDKLTNYNGKSITYDKIGNPLTIGTDTTLTWEAGRRLANITKAGVSTSFIYNADGYRTSKTSGGVTTTYHLDGSRITAMIKGTDELSFAYDENGAVIGLYHNGTAYAYAKNLQGDIIGIIDGNGNWIVTYEYDAWGNPITTAGTLADTLGNLNPFRYRGYVYDAETGFYYVSSRYYDPEIGRFISADTIDILTITPKALTDKNLFNYCDCNPVIRIDVTGYAWETIFDVASLGTSIIEVATNPADPWAWAGLVGDSIDLIPFVTGVGEITRTIKVVNKVDNVADAAKTTRKIDTGATVTKKIHGNSLKSNKINYGYALVDKNNNIMKFGETINPKRRYTKNYLSSNGYTMKILDFGSKKYIHDWQFDMNMHYLSKYKFLPPLNKRGW